MNDRWERLWAIQDKGRDHFIEKMSERFRRRGHVRLPDKTKKGYQVLLFKSTRPDCELQLSWFDDKGLPWGHACYDSPEHAAKGIWRDHLPTAFKERIYYHYGWDGLDEDALWELE